jgi:DNA-binding transcriptional ArsR family regulator
MAATSDHGVEDRLAKLLKRLHASDLADEVESLVHHHPGQHGPVRRSQPRSLPQWARDCPGNGHLRDGPRFTCAPLSVPITYNYMVVGYSLTEEDVDRIFQALADQTRRDIFRRAIQSSESVSALSRHYEMSFAAVQKHVAVLERAGLVTKQRRGREQIVHTNRTTLRRAITLLDAYEQLWTQRIDQISDILKITEGEPTWP